jgi:signal transduction histidine kinase
VNVAGRVPVSSVRTRAGPRPALLATIGIAGALAAALSVWLAFVSDHVDEPSIQAGLMVWMIVGYLSAGLVAWWRRPGPFGPLMIIAGFGIFLSSLAWSNVPALFTLGIVFDLVAAVLFMHVFLSFPTGRLIGTPERVLVGVGYFTAFALQLVGLLLGGFGPDNVLAVGSDGDAARDLLHGQLAALSAVALLAIAVLVARRIRLGPPLRRSVTLLVDSFAFVLVMTAFLYLSAAFGLVEGDTAFETIRRVTFVALGLAPLVFLFGVLHTELLHTGVSALLLELQADPGPHNLNVAIARSLRDPSLEVAYWLPGFESYADADGRPVTLPIGDGRGVTIVERDGAPLAALLHDPALLDEPELLDAVAATAAIALQNARLQAELRARVDELADSRARVIDAERRERQRLERNLHDGAQQRLVALSLDLGRLAARCGDDAEITTGLDLARGQVARSLAELRDVARGIHPAVVSAHGLGVALEELTAFGPIPVELAVSLEGRLPEPVEVAAYYVVSESLANVGKHARAASATVTIGRVNGSVVVEVVDDGVGGADTEAGSGLRGLADRVEALGGRLRVWTEMGHGTRIRAEIPCGS